MKTRKFARICSIYALPRSAESQRVFRIAHFTKLRKMGHIGVRGTLTSMGSLSRENARQKHDGQTSKGKAFGNARKMRNLRTASSNLKSWWIT